jgi:hypothetical protein
MHARNRKRNGIGNAAIASWLVATCLLASPPLALGDEDRVVTNLGEDHFAAGGIVTLRSPVRGDAMLAGGTIESSAEIGGDVAAAGGQIDIGGSVGDDLYVAGGSVDVDARVGGNARITGGRVSVGPDAQVVGGATIAGGNVVLAGSFGPYLSVAGGNVRLGGRVAGDVTVRAGTLSFEPGTQIDGKLTYSTRERTTIPEGVVIAGGAEHRPLAWHADGERWRDRDHDERGVSWIWTLGLFGVGLLLALAFPAFSARTGAAAAARPWLALGVGFLALIVVPAAMIVLLITIIGIPLAVIVLLLYVVALIVGYVTGALFLADRALGALRPAASASLGWRVGALAIVLLGLALIGLVPFLGGLVRFAVLLLGLGALALAVTRARGATTPPAAPPAAPPTPPAAPA